MNNQRERLYRIWRNMKGRCYNPNKDHYENYGGRGIEVCDKWKNDFPAFYRWARRNGYQDNLSIDRIDNDGNYCPKNCRWITMAEQQKNKQPRKNIKKLNYVGFSLPISEWARIKGMSPRLVRSRVDSGWSVERALNTPPPSYGKVPEPIKYSPLDTENMGEYI